MIAGMGWGQWPHVHQNSILLAGAKRTCQTFSNGDRIHRVHSDAFGSRDVLVSSIAYNTQIMAETGYNQIICIGFYSQAIQEITDTKTVISGIDHMGSNISPEMMGLIAGCLEFR